MAMFNALKRIPVIYRVCLGILGMIGLTFALRHLSAVDWSFFYAAGRAALALQNPYTGGFMSPPYSLPFFALIAMLGPELSRGLIAALTLAASFYMCWKLKAGVISTILFLLSAPVFWVFYIGNIDVLILLALFLPATGSIILSGIKPHITSGLVLYHVYFAWKEKRLLQILWLPGLLALICLPFVPLILDSMRMVIAQDWNASIWPWGIPLGIVMLFIGIYYRRPSLALVASCFLTPYLSFKSYGGIFIVMLANLSGWRRDLTMLILVIASWLYVWLH